MNGKKMKLTERRRAIFHMEMAEDHMRDAQGHLLDVADAIAQYPEMANISTEIDSLIDAVKALKEKIAGTRRQAQQEELPL